MKTLKQINAEMRMILDGAEAAGRDNLTVDEERRYAELDREYTRLQGGQFRGMVSDTSDHGQHFTTYLRTGHVAPEMRATLDANALSTAPGAPAAGATGYSAGYMVPQEFWQNLQVAMRAYGGVLSSIRTVDTPATGAPMPWPTVDPTNIQGYHLTEANQAGFGVGQATSGGTAMIDMQFGQGMLAAYTAVSGVVLASIQLVQDSAFNVDEFVSERMSEAIGRLLAQVAITGTGSSQGLGIQTALVARGAVSPFAPATGSSGGVYAAAGGSVNVLGGGSVNSLTAGIPSANDLELMSHCIDPAYSENAKWFVSDQGLSGLRRVANSLGEPLLQDPANGGPPTLWGKPVVIDPNLGAVSSTASTVGGILYGDMSRAMVYRRAPAGVLRLAERYADFMQVGFLSYQRYDIRSNDLRAAVIYKSPAA